MTQLCTQKDHNGGTTRDCADEAVMYTPRFDICETEDELVLYGDLPGVEAGDLDIGYEDRELRIYGKVAKRHEGKQHLRGEYGIGDFHRTFAVGESIDPDKITADLQNGVVTIHLPKSEAAKPKRIEIKTA